MYGSESLIFKSTFCAFLLIFFMVGSTSQVTGAEIEACKHWNETENTQEVVAINTLREKVVKFFEGLFMLKETQAGLQKSKDLDLFMTIRSDYSSRPKCFKNKKSELRAGIIFTTLLVL